jgi:hypothetical protein
VGRAYLCGSRSKKTLKMIESKDVPEGSQKCPKCGLLSPSSAQWCDCGYVFSFQDKNSYLSPTEQEEAREKEAKVAIRNWHPGKIALIWVIDLAILLALWSLVAYGEDKALMVFVWLILSIPVFVITWRWLSGREGQ